MFVLRRSRGRQEEGKDMGKMTKEEKQARITHLREIAKAYEEGKDPEQIAKDYPALVARYSIRNCFLILAQRPDATECAGFKDWGTVGRQVKKGSKGIAILVPMRKKDSEDVWFSWRYVFDISDTETVAEEVAA
jgi:hypothetical protein